jgi:hypothetical protein
MNGGKLMSPERVALLLMCDICKERAQFTSSDEVAARRKAHEAQWLTASGGFIACPDCTGPDAITNNPS